tara:strand:+ start:364 stop:1329 length:966 start_codon:yes stop_codon:yes gene_type:complete
MIKINRFIGNKKNKTNFIFFITLSLFSIVLISACSKNKIDKSINDKPFVLTTFTILADLASNVAGDRLSVRSITKAGSEIHGYQFTPSDIVRSQGAKLIIENGLGLESWINGFTTTLGDIPRVKLTDGMKVLMIEEDVYAGKPNPHAWMSPKRAMDYVDKIVDAFIKIDPEGEIEYKANASSYKSKLESLDKELRKALATIPKERRVLVTCEGAFTYLAHDYGLKEAYLWPVNSESQVTPRRMIKLIEKIKEASVPTIFCESTVSSKAQMEVAKSSGAAFGGVFYVDSLSEKDGPAPTLIDLQKHNVRLITDGLSVESLSK